MEARRLSWRRRRRRRRRKAKEKKSFFFEEKDAFIFFLNKHQSISALIANNILIYWEFFLLFYFFISFYSLPSNSFAVFHFTKLNLINKFLLLLYIVFFPKKRRQILKWLCYFIKNQSILKEIKISENLESFFGDSYLFYLEKFKLKFWDFQSNCK